MAILLGAYSIGEICIFGTFCALIARVVAAQDTIQEKIATKAELKV
jgi:hypothetical protein